MGRGRTAGRLARIVAISAASLAIAAVAGCGGDDADEAATGSTPAAEEDVTVGFITKAETNPYFGSIVKSAKEEADKAGINLITAAAKTDTDNASQVAAMESMVSQGAKSIIVLAADYKAIVPAIEKTRATGVQVVAVDTATDPVDAVDALFATDQKNAGKLIGEWAKAAFAGKEAKIAMLDADPGSGPGKERHDGFLEGFGITEDDPQVAGMANSHATIEGAQSAMETLLQKDPSINLVYAVNEPAGYGAHNAIERAGKSDSITLVTIDGSCEGIRWVEDGKFAANAQQYPAAMAEMGIKASIDFIRDGKKAAGNVDTGEELVTATPVDGVESHDPAWGAERCWGE